jgi:hypothetical protein
MNLIDKGKELELRERLEVLLLSTGAVRLATS